MGILSLVFSLFGILFAYASYRGIYNRYFHPPRHFPGPFWASVSDFFKLWVVHTKQIHTLGLEAHRKYGPIIRVAPNLLTFNDPRLLPTVYHRRVDKTDMYTVGALGDLAPPFQTMKHDEHAAKRKRIASSVSRHIPTTERCTVPVPLIPQKFTLTNLKRLESQLDDGIQEWLGALKKRFADTGEKMDYARWSHYFVHDMMTQLSFGEPIGHVKQGRDVDNLIDNFHQMTPFAGFIAALPWVVKPLWESRIGKWLFMPKPGDNTGTGKIMAYRDRLLEERLNHPKSHHKGDFLDNILASKNEDGSPISIEEVKVEGFVLLVAASDTMASFFGGFMRYIVETPGVYEKMMTEIDDFDRKGLLSTPVPTFDEVREMPYFVACFRETLRLYPSTPSIIPRYVSEGGITLHGKYVPAGAEIRANPYITNRDNNIFGEDADSFRPGRWLENAEREREMERYFFSWGYGSRGCLGKNIAQLESYKTMVQFFRTFKPSFCDVERVWRQENLAIFVHWDMWMNIENRGVHPESQKL